MDEFYVIPLDTRALLAKKRLRKVELENSIRQNIMLILLSRMEEYRFDSEYGCSMWEEDFVNVPSTNVWKEHLRRSIFSSIEAYEKRLTELKLSIKIDEMPFTNPENPNIRKIKKRIQVIILAKLAKTKEDFKHSEVLFFSPISLD